MFTFRFETLLRARRHAEEIFQKELSEAHRALAEEKGALKAARDRRRHGVEELQRLHQKVFHAADAQLHERYLGRLEREIERQKKQVASAERRMHQKRHALINAVKRRKMLERLKTKDLQAHLSAMAVKERKFMDDVAIFSRASTRGVGSGEN
jgi:flagellar FliJ protein